MISLLIFDMDGTLIELKEVHYHALNLALAEIDPKFIISDEEHNTIFDGLPTKNKLNMLTTMKGLKESDHKQIWDRKQYLTIEVIKEKLKPDLQVNDTIKRLKEDGYKMVVASNSISKTIQTALVYSGLVDYFDGYISNEDVRLPKPNPQMFNKVMLTHRKKPFEVMIFEDSRYGIEAAKAAGAYLYEVKNTKDIIYDKIKFQLDFIRDSQGLYR